MATAMISPLAFSPPAELLLESGTIRRTTPDCQTCHTAFSDSRWRHFLFRQ